MITTVSMKRLFSFFLVLLSILILSKPYTVSAQIASGSATPSATTTYDLAFPGLLPDHPLHFIKVVRDKVVSALINDPIKRAEFNLLTSDKRFNAGLYLIKKKKYTLAATTISKSNNYLHDAIVAAERAKKMNQDIGSLSDTLHNAILKRRELITSFYDNLDTSSQEMLDKETQRLDTLEKRVNAL